MSTSQDLIRLIAESTLEQGEQPNVITINKDTLMHNLAMYLVEHDTQLVEQARKESKQR